MTPEERTDEWLRQMHRTFPPLSPPRVRHRRKESAVLAAVITTVVAAMLALAFLIVWLLS